MLHTVACRELISIHAPAWGATSGLRKELKTLSYFNPRSRMGSDCAMKMIPFHRIWEVLFREPCFTGCCHLTEF